MAKVATTSSECAEALKTLLGAAGCLEAEESSRKPFSLRVTETVFYASQKSLLCSVRC